MCGFPFVRLGVGRVVRYGYHSKLKGGGVSSVTRLGCFPSFSASPCCLSLDYNAIIDKVSYNSSTRWYRVMLKPSVLLFWPSGGWDVIEELDGNLVSIEGGC